MKCQKCDREATFHITEMTGDRPVEVHLCEEHTREYLDQIADDSSSPVAGMAAAMAKELSQRLVGQTATDLNRLDEATCPVCGISFREFRNQGRFGCPQDYVVFHDQLPALLENIHGVASHPTAFPVEAIRNSQNCTRLIRLRRDLADAISEEDYERASQLRDQIRSTEQSYVHRSVAVK
ncbi:MAG: UvrB/UvrC motif-containing protein [Planctomycetia bacterium]|nr:UvrB/UvrC motif-containing protein [Planctomycetia bacterium]